MGHHTVQRVYSPQRSPPHEHGSFVGWSAAGDAPWTPRSGRAGAHLNVKIFLQEKDPVTQCSSRHESVVDPDRLDNGGLGCTVRNMARTFEPVTCPHLSLPLPAIHKVDHLDHIWVSVCCSCCHLRYQTPTSHLHANDHHWIDFIFAVVVVDQLILNEVQKGSGYGRASLDVENVGRLRAVVERKGEPGDK